MRRLPTLLLLLGLPLLASPGRPPVPDEQLVALQAGAPGVISAIIKTDFIAQPPEGPEWPAPPIDLDPSRWQVNGKTPRSIHRYSLPFDALAARHNSHPVQVRHRVYLVLDSALEDGRRYNVRSPYGRQALAYSDTTTRCEAIKVNQGGYHPGLAQRFANFGVFLGDGGSLNYSEAPKFRVWHAGSRTLISEGSARFLVDDTGVAPRPGASPYRSGESVYRLSLTGVPPGGPYFVSVAGCGRSADFRVGRSAVRDMARLALRGIYHQRCGIELASPHTAHSRGICAMSHRDIADTRQAFPATTGDAQGWIPVTGSEPTRTVIGGWHDAGDFDRRASHLAPLLWWLSYYEALQDHAPWSDDGWLNIPESGNGVPDFLDEASWALQAWRSLQLDGSDANGGAVLAGTEAAAHPGYGEVSAASDRLRYGTYALDVRVTAWSAGAFAQMARLWRTLDPQRSGQWLAAASRAWDWLSQQPSGEVPVARAYAAMQLYLTTGETVFHEAFREQWTAIESGATQWPEQCLAQNASAQCQLAQFAMYFHPRYRHMADADIVQRGLQRLESIATGTGYHCDNPGAEPPEPYPQCLRAWGDWGRQVTTALRSDYWVWAWLLLDDHPDRSHWFDATALLAQYATGLNPLGRPFYTGLGNEALRSSTHLDSYFTKFGHSDGTTDTHLDRPIGQVPGLLIFGPGNHRGASRWERAVTDKLFPAWDQLPRQRRWGDGWSAIGQNEVLTTNMAYQALVYTFLAAIPAPCVGPSSLTPSDCRR